MILEKSLLKWIAANALGLGVGFIAYVQTFNLMEYGLDTWMHWRSGPPGQDAYASILVALLVGGAILGSAQALILRSRSARIVPWIVATAAGFGFLVILVWPLLAAEIFGRIPGPAEPIIVTVGGGSLAGVLQHLALRRQGIHAPKWLVRWILGLVASLVPTALLFISLEGLRVSLSWPMEVFLSGFMVAGVAAWISGKALFAALSEWPDSGHGKAGAV